MAITTSKPLAILEPSRPYNRLAPSFSISTVVSPDGKGVDVNFSLSFFRYRQLTDGTIEIAPRDKGEESISIGRANEAAKTDSALLNFLNAVEDAFRALVIARGL